MVQVNGLSGYFRMIDLSVRCRTLLGLADDVPKPEPEHGAEAGGSGPAAAAAVFAVPREKLEPENTDPGARLADVGLASGRALCDCRSAAPNAHHDAGL